MGRPPSRVQEPKWSYTTITSVYNIVTDTHICKAHSSDVRGVGFTVTVTVQIPNGTHTCRKRQHGASVEQQLFSKMGAWIVTCITVLCRSRTDRRSLSPFHTHDWVRTTHTRRAMGFPQPTQSNANLIGNHSHRHTQKQCLIYSSCVPVKLLHQINHHISEEKEPECGES